ncbi:MAG: cytochrome P450, partial [Bacteroidota bacterium]
GPFDFIQCFAQPLPVLTICSILGLPPEDYRKLKHLGAKLTETLGLYVTLKELVAINSAARDLIDYFAQWLNDKRRHPDNSLISQILILNEKDGALLTDQELISLYIFLFIAGEETSANLLGAGTYNLMQHRESWQTLCSNPHVANTSVEELLRFDPSVQIAGRTALHDLTFAGKKIPAGSTLSLVIGSANRDERAFEAPNELRIDRTPNRHLTFGLGTHHCMGDWLARRQAAIAFVTLTQRFPTLHLTKEAPEWNRVLTFRSLNRLMVAVG